VSGTRKEKLARFRSAFVENYLTIDARSLGLGRIVLAIVLLVDLARRVPVLKLFYSNEGLVPNHMMLWRPPTQWMFSFFFILSHPDEVAVGFIICGLIYLGLLVGWHTRLMQFLALIAVLSLHGRVTLLENGGDWMLGELALWTAFLPLGLRFSLDAVRASMRKRRETNTAQLVDRTAFAPEGIGPRVVSLAALALVLQLANSYLFNALHKGGQTWRQGTAVHYVLHQDRMITWFAEWMRPYMTLWLSRALSWGSLVTESILPVLLLAPVQKVWSRRVAIVAIIALHSGFQCFINLGVFSWAMIAYTPFLLTAADWEWFVRRAAARTARRGRLTAYFDAGCGVCFQIVRLFARLDRYDRVKFVSSAELATDSAVNPDLLARTMLVVDEATGRKYTRADGVAQIMRAFPVGWLWSLPLRLPILRGLANRAYDVFSRRRVQISVGLGLAACALPPRPAPAVAEAPAPDAAAAADVPAHDAAAAADVPAPDAPPVDAAPPAESVLAAAPVVAPLVADAPAPALEPPPPAPPQPPPGPIWTATPEPAPIIMVLRRALMILREGAVLALIITLVSETLFINGAIPRFLKHEQPLWIKRLVAYPRLIQAWSMFASDAPVGDQTLVVDAVTADGRHVDPYSEATGRYPNPGRFQIPTRLDNDSFVFNYSGRLPTSPAYHQAFIEWVLRYHERTGRPQDRIVSFEAWQVDDDSPPVGELEPRNVRSKSFLRYP
jgi:predicted DCC family thiol-disulfide oxidoreductase YuxK